MEALKILENIRRLILRHQKLIFGIGIYIDMGLYQTLKIRWRSSKNSSIFGGKIFLKFFSSNQVDKNHKLVIKQKRRMWHEKQKVL